MTDHIPAPWIGDRREQFICLLWCEDQQLWTGWARYNTEVKHYDANTLAEVSAVLAEWIRDKRKQTRDRAEGVRN